MPLSAPKHAMNHYPLNEERKLLRMPSMHAGTNTKKARTFNVKLTYNEIMLLNRLIDRVVIARDLKGINTKTDTQCIILHKIKDKIIHAYM